MKARKATPTFGVALLLAIVVFLSIRAGTQAPATEKFVPNEVLLRFKDKADVNSIKNVLAMVQGRIQTSAGLDIDSASWDPQVLSNRSFVLDDRTCHITVPEAVGTERAIEILKSNPNIEYAERNNIYHAFVNPNDTRFIDLWGLRNVGQSGGTVDADIDASEAWDIYTGNPDMVVAIIDSGIDYNHVDLASNIWTNPDEIPGNGLDDDGNGFIDDIRGWNFVSNGNDPMDDYNPYYHGTHVAGTIGAVGNNALGITGVNWQVKLMPVKIIDFLGHLTDARVASGIDYATANGARISNNSYGIQSFSYTVLGAISRAQLAGSLYVAACGNYPDVPERDNDKTPVYPASFGLTNIVSVLATDHNDNLASFSHYGETSVDIGAPGGSAVPNRMDADILSTLMGNGYQFLYGTSMASPHVAGVAALAKGKVPELTYSQLKGRLLAQVDILPSLVDRCVSGGRLNAYKVIFDPAVPSGAPSSCTADPTGWTTIRVSWQDNATNEIGFAVQKRNPGLPDYFYLTSSDANITRADDGSCTAGDTYTYRIKAYNMAGYSAFTGEAQAAIPVGVPGSPINLHARWDSGLDAVVLTWGDGSNNEEFFIVERKSEWEEEWQEITQLGQNEQSYNDEDVAPDTFYSYRIKAANPIGHSYSGQVQVHVPYF